MLEKHMMFLSRFTAVLQLCLLIIFIVAGPIADADENATLNAEVGRGRRRDLKNTITEEVLEDVFENCQESLKSRRDLEAKLFDKGRVIKNSERKTDLSLIRMRKSDPAVHHREECHLPFDIGSHILYERYNLTPEEIEQTLPTLSLTGQRSQRNSDTCTEAIASTQCDENAWFRTADGQCNNLQNPTWGSAMSCMRRLLPANYIGNSDFRESVLGGPLPEPRLLSRNLHYDLNRPTNYVTHIYMHFGQLLDHDVALTPQSTTVDNLPIQCCPPEQETHPQCRPIIIPNNDPFYSRFGIRCMNFVRSAICPTCTLGPRQHMDQVTHFIDASFVYGNSNNETMSLRTNDGTGRMRVQTSNYGDLLPQSSNPTDDQCSFPNTNDICFEAGDPRANQHTVLTSLHTIFLREHNRLASELRQINPRWRDERIFQEARRIVGAEMQTIVYKEYLTITVGGERMQYFHLNIGGESKYDETIDPSMISEFTTAGFRFGHSLINSIVANYPLNSTNQRRLLRDEFFQPFDLYRGFVGPLLRGSSNSPAQWFDQHLVPDVTNYLYRIRGDQTGLDLASINIQRGRDHGMPTYVDTVRYCSQGSIIIRQFNDLVSKRLMNRTQAVALERNYRNVNDIDLWPGILMEIPNENAVVGPTGACILGIQFYKLKYGDRFYFEHDNTNVRFSYGQMNELSKVNLSTIICLNSDVQQIAMNAMLFDSRNNPLINCKNVRGIDLSYWRY